MHPPTPQQIVFLLLVATLVSMIARRLRLPSQVGLLAAGLGLALLPAHGNLGLTPDILFIVLLPALVFESAINLRGSELREDWPPLLILVTIGVAISTGVTAAVMHALIGWNWHTALIFGAITSATDPIAVLATFREAHVTGRPRLLAEAESLLNDGVAIVALGLIALAAGHHAPASLLASAGLSLLKTVAGGVAIGALVGWLMTLLMSRSGDPLAETTLTFIGAYGAYYLADRFGASGILATVASGLVMSNIGVLGKRYLTERGREIVEALWEFAAFVANALVFLLMGYNLEHAQLFHEIGLLTAAICAALLGRAIAVYTSCALVSRTRWQIPIPLQHILVWGGQRGALGLILAVAMRETGGGYTLVAATAGVVAFSIFVQGLTFRPLLKKLMRNAPSDLSAEATTENG